MFRPDRRWIRNWQKPHPRSCLVHREAASCILTPTAWGGHTAAGSMPGMAIASWFAHPAVSPECPGSLSSHRAHFREPPLGLRETLGASHVTCIVLCPLNDFDTENRTSSTLHSSCSHKWSSARRLPIFCQPSASALGPLKHVNAEDPFSAASHTFLSF